MKEVMQTVNMEDTLWMVVPHEYLEAIVHELTLLKQKNCEFEEHIELLNKKVCKCQKLNKIIRSLKNTWSIRGIEWYLTIFC